MKYVVFLFLTITYFLVNAQTAELVLPYGHIGKVTSVAFSPDGLYSITASEDATIKIWDNRSGKLLRNLDEHTDAVYYASFSKDGKSIISISRDNTLKVWDFETGNVIHNSVCPEYDFIFLGFNPNLTNFATVSFQETEIKLWDFSGNSWKLVKKFEDPEGITRMVRFSNDGKQLMSTSANEKVHVRDIKSGKLVMTLNLKKEVLEMQFSPDRTSLLTVSYDKKVTVWDAIKGNELYTLSLQGQYNSSASYSNDSKMIVTTCDSKDKTVMIWDSKTGRLLQTINLDNFIKSAEFSPDNTKLWIHTFYESSICYDVLNQKILYEIGGSTPCAFSPDGKTILTTSNFGLGYYSDQIDGIPKLWRTENGKLIHKLEGHTAYVINARFNPIDSKLMNISSDYHIKLWDFVNGKLQYSIFENEIYYMEDAWFSNDGQRFIIYTSKSYIIYDSHNGNKLFSSQNLDFANWFLNGRNEIPRAEFDPEFKYYLKIFPDSISELYSIYDTVLIKRFPKNKTLPFFIKNKEQIFTEDTIGNQYIWDSRTGMLLHSLKDTISTDRFSYLEQVDTSANDDAEFFSDSIMNIIDEFIGLMDTTVITLPDDTIDNFLIFPDDPIIIDSTLSYLYPDSLMIPNDTTQLDITLQPNSGVEVVAIDYGALYSPNDSVIITVNQNAFYESRYIRFWDAFSDTLILAVEYTGYLYDFSQLKFSPEFWKSAVEESIDLSGQEGPYSTNVKFTNLVSGEFFVFEGKFFDEDNSPFSTDGSKLFTRTEAGKIKIWNTVIGNLLAETENPIEGSQIMGAGFNPSGTEFYYYTGKVNDRGYIYAYGPLKIIDINENIIKTEIPYTKNKPSDINWKDSLIIYSDNSKLLLFDLNTGKELVSFIGIDDDDYIFMIPSGEYMGTKPAIRKLSWRIDNKLYDFEYRDLQYNRPDKVLEQFGNTNYELIKMYRKAYDKRLKKMGFNEDMFSPDRHVPVIKLLLADQTEYVTQKNEATITFKASDSKYKLDRIMIRVNDVPIHGIRGLSVRDKNSNALTMTLSVPLNSGENSIKVTCINEKGVESGSESYDVFYDAIETKKPDLYLISVSSNQYLQSGFNLSYAVNDGLAMADLFASFKDQYDHIYLDTLFNQNAVKENVYKIKEKLLKSNPDDRVVFFAAGHGLLDDNMDFYYATHDIDFYNPSLRGLSYEDLEGLLDSIPARHKLLMIDACHSGLVDKPELSIVTDSVTLADGSRAGIHTYGYKRDVTDTDYTLNINNTFELMQQLFTDFSFGSGTVIIAASAGDGYALELHNIEHGVFTWCVMEGIQKAYADKNHDQFITVNELKEYVLKAVKVYTNGQQRPAVRNESIDYDFNLK